MTHPQSFLFDEMKCPGRERTYLAALEHEWPNGNSQFMHIKIGRTNYPKRRHGNLQTGSPGKIVFKEFGPWLDEIANRKREREFHQSLKSFACDGGKDWFCVPLHIFLLVRRAFNKQHPQEFLEGSAIQAAMDAQFDPEKYPHARSSVLLCPKKIEL